jgi:Xaa-Pro aminopeptidase
LKKLQQDIHVPFSPHCVGLSHTEQPLLDSNGDAIDTVLEPGMIISVDCPLLETSTLGTAHLEDLVLITPEGHTPIHDTGNNFITV